MKPPTTVILSRSECAELVHYVAQIRANAILSRQKLAPAPLIYPGPVCHEVLARMTACAGSIQPGLWPRKTAGTPAPKPQEPADECLVDGGV